MFEKIQYAPFVNAFYPTLYVSNLEDAVQWYCEKLCFQVMAYNPQFAVMEIAPGRLCEVSKNPEQIGMTNIGLHVPTAKKFHEHLTGLGVDVDPIEKGLGNSIHYHFRDPDGNRFFVWSGMFGMNAVNYEPLPRVANIDRFSYVSKPEIHAVGLEVIVPSSNSEPAMAEAKEKLQQLLTNTGLESCLENDVFYIKPVLDKYSGAKQHALHVCVQSTPDMEVPAELTEFHIPPRSYAVFSFDRSKSDFRDSYSHKYYWLTEQVGFLNPPPESSEDYHLEFIHDDRIDSYFPIELRKG